jgi:hypothetical protein
MTRFWSLIHTNWVELWHTLSRVHDYSDVARLVPLDEASDPASITVAADIKLAKKYHSLRIVPYLNACEGDSLIDEILYAIGSAAENDRPVWTGSHPLVA